MMLSRRSLMIAGAAVALTATAPAFAQDAADYYKGKTVTILVGSPPGGGYDAYARMIAPYLAERLGADVVIDNRPGGGGLLALNMLSTSRPDGLTLMHVSAEGAIMSQLSDRAGARFDVSKLNWLARTATESKLWFVKPDSPIHTVADAQAAEEITWSATGPADNISDVAAIISHSLDLNSKIITGYKGAKDMALAVVNGEVDSGVVSGSSMLSLVKSGKVRPIAMISQERWDQLPDVPTIYEAAKLDDDATWWLKMREDIGEAQRAMVTGPGVPADKVQYLRTAMADVLTDPALVEEAKASRRPISFMSGDDLQALIEELMASVDGEKLEQLRTIILEDYM